MERFEVYEMEPRTDGRHLLLVKDGLVINGQWRVKPIPSQGEPRVMGDFLGARGDMTAIRIGFVEVDPTQYHGRCSAVDYDEVLHRFRNTPKVVPLKPLKSFMEGWNE